MRATSNVLVQLQRQHTVLALPPRLVVASLLCGVAVMMIGVATAHAVFVLLGFVGGFTGAWAFFFQRARRNPHYDREFILARRFWHGSGEERFLIAAGRRP